LGKAYTYLSFLALFLPNSWRSSISMQHLTFFLCVLVGVLGDGVCGPMFTADCTQFFSVNSCTCAPGSTDQSCAQASQLQYFTYDAASQSFMYCQWQFAPFAGAMQCGPGSKCTPSTTPALEVCQSNLQAKSTQTSTLSNTINQLKQQLLDSQANASRIQYQLDLERIDNEEIRMELAKGGIFTADLQNEVQANLTMELAADLTLNQTLIDAQNNLTYYRRLICGAHQGCCPYNAAVSTAPLLVASLSLILFA